MIMTWILLGAAAATLVTAAVLALRPKQVRFSFADREDHVALVIERQLGADDVSLVNMTFLREAARLRLVSDYRRFLVDVRRLTVPSEASFWLLVGGMGPLLLEERVKVAFVCHPRKGLAKRFRNADLADSFPSERSALSWLRSGAPPRPCTLDKDWVDSLLLPRRRAGSPAPVRKAA
jgi:hypothetical protein